MTFSEKIKAKLSGSKGKRFTFLFKFGVSTVATVQNVGEDYVEVRGGFGSDSERSSGIYLVNEIAAIQDY